MNKFERGKVPYERSDEKIVYLKLCTKEKDCISSSPTDNLEKRLRFVIHKLTTNTDTGFNLLEDIFECMVMNDSFQKKMAEEARRLELLGLRRIIPPSSDSEQPKSLLYHGFLRKELAGILGSFRGPSQRSRKPNIDPALLLEGNQRRTRSQTNLMNKSKESDIKKSVQELLKDPKVTKNIDKIFQNKRKWLSTISAEEIEQWQEIINKEARTTFNRPSFQANLKVPKLTKSHLPSNEDILDILPLDLSIGN